MTAPTAPTAPTSPSANTPLAPAGVRTVRQEARARWSRWRWLVAVVLVLAGAALVTTLSRSITGDRGRLGPENPAPEGSAAVVQVLRGQGVDVRAVDRSTEAVDATGPDSTLLVLNPHLLAPEQRERLAGDDVDTLVLVEPDELTLAALAPDVHTAGRSEAAVRDPDCTVPAGVAAGSVRAGGALYALAEEPAVGTRGAALCYRDPADPTRASYVVEQQVGRTVIIIGQSDLLTNAYLDDDGNAALGLWSLGRQPSLTWYSPDPLEPVSSGSVQPSLTDLLPDWVLWVLLQLAITVGVVILWRARRLGRLVPEPLPVVVRAAETQEGRARLYRQSSARGRAATTLRATTRRRLAGRLAAPSGTTAEQLVVLVSDTIGARDGQRRVHDLLLGPAPESDAALVRLADDLDTLEREIAR